MGNITVTDFNNKLIYEGPEEGYYKPSDDTKICNWNIFVKGDYHSSCKDPVLKKNYSDLKYGNGVVYFRGTSKECDSIEDQLAKNGLKIIGTKEDKSEGISRESARLLYLKAVNKETALSVSEVEENTPKVVAQRKVTKRIWEWYLSK